MDLVKLIEILNRYPLWFKWGVGLWIVAGALLIVGLITLWPAKSGSSTAVIPRVTSTVPKQERVFVGASITPEYLISIFREHTDIQGAKLTEAYLGKWMKVSGSLGNVSSTDSKNYVQLTFERAEVPFTERTWVDYIDFYMIFEKPWIDRLAIAKRGDKLTVVGQIERIDGVSVQLENCELVGSDSN